MALVSFPVRAFGLPAPSARSEATARGSRRRRSLTPLLAAGLLLGAAQGVSAQSLRGSSASLDRQVAQARQHDFTRLTGAAQLRRFVDAGLLVHLSGNRDYTLVDVSFPFARPEVRLFIERLSSQYRRACNERLVVTSLTRPLSHQPRNASDRSVHPTGMAIDLRRPAGRCRGWLEEVLLSLEARGVLEATRERRPPHYHVAVYPKPYAAYVRGLTPGSADGSAETSRAAGGSAVTSRAARGTAETSRAARGSGETPTAEAATVHVVRRGDSLERIARRYGATVEGLRRANGLGSSLIHPGQSLRVPGAERPADPAAYGSGEAPAGDAAAVHVVRGGDSLERIASRYGATVEGLRRANGLGSSLIHPGQSLRVPGAERPADPAAGGSREVPTGDAVVVHVVRRGDSLERIADRYGATVEGLRRANGLGSSLIHPGQSLRVPGAARAAGGSGETPAGDAVAVHVVRRGDSLERIARRYGATVAGLRRANGLRSSLIHPGQSLRVPGARPAAADAVTLHVVRRGDTLDRIARLYGATIAALRRANGLRSSLIHPGQSLRIPLTRR